MNTAKSGEKILNSIFIVITHLSQFVYDLEGHNCSAK